MSLPLTPTFLVGVAVVAVVAGAVNGLAGFGFAVVATMALATVIDPAVAVVFMIVPILAVNVVLVQELSLLDLRSCGTRFWPLAVGALVGMVAGLAVLDQLPDGPLRIALGLVTLAFVATTQQAVPIPALTRATEGCFVETTPAMIGVGGLSGLLFGGTNVGVQFVAYLKSCNLSHGLFIGVIAMLFVGLNSVRVAAAGALGLYPDVTVFWLSIVATVPAVAGVAVGSRLRGAVSERARRTAVFSLLTFIGIRLLLGGAGIA